MSLLHPTRPNTPVSATPHLDRVFPSAAIPGGTFEVLGSHIVLPPSEAHPARLPQVFFGETPAALDLARPTRALVRVPYGAISSDLTLRRSGHLSNAIHASIGVPMADELHLVSNPAADADGNLFAMVSGSRGQSVPVSIFRIARDLQVRPFARDLLNISSLAFGPADLNGQADLYASSRSEGVIYRISTSGRISTFAEGMGIATGIAFDQSGSLYVGDRSGTIFKLTPRGPDETPEIFVFATLEPSVAFYHLCFRADGTLLVTAPTTSSNQPIYAISPKGDATVFFQGLGRPQGMAFDIDGNLYVAASLQGQRGIVRITPSLAAELVVAGNDLVGLCFLDDGCCALATQTTIFHTDLGIEGKSLL